MFEVAVRKGTAKSWDHAQLVHSQMFHAVVAKMELYVVRVGTEDNIADLPSRGVLSPLHGRVCVVLCCAGL